MNRKSIVLISGTNEFDAYYAIKKAFDFFKIKLNLDRVAIKLNLCSVKFRETGATSDLIVVEHLVRFLNERGIRVSLVESNSGSKNADLAFEYLGFKKLEKKYDVKCVNLSRDDYIIKKIDGYFLNKVKIPRTLESADYFITHPKLKTHSSMKLHITGALKNQFGCLMKLKKESYHTMIHEVIADVNQAFTPDFTIMDSIIAMTGYGPTNGIPQRLNLLITSQDPVAVDALGAKIFGFNPHSLKFLRLASRKGLGSLESVLYRDNMKNPDFKMHINRFVTSMFEILNSIGISGTVE